MVKEKTRTVDELGRIVIPFEMRNYLNIGEKDDICVGMSGKNIILKKIENSNEIKQFTILDKQMEINIQISYRIKNNNYIRKVNELGMMVIPAEIRKEARINTRDKIKMCLKNDYIILIKER